MELWVEGTGCKQVLLFKNIGLPWQPELKKDDYDYLWVSVYDKETHRIFWGERKRDKIGSPEAYERFWRKFKESNLSTAVGFLGAIQEITRTGD
jgi:hypothetical protein